MSDKEIKNSIRKTATENYRKIPVQFVNNSSLESFYVNGFMAGYEHCHTVELQAVQELKICKEILKLILDSKKKAILPIHTLYPSHYTILFARSIVEDDLDIDRALKFLENKREEVSSATIS